MLGITWCLPTLWTNKNGNSVNCPTLTTAAKLSGKSGRAVNYGHTHTTLRRGQTRQQVKTPVWLDFLTDFSDWSFMYKSEEQANTVTLKYFYLIYKLLVTLFQISFTVLQRHLVVAASFIPVQYPFFLQESYMPFFGGGITWWSLWQVKMVIYSSASLKQLLF